jgi:small-conductance mechanosensitive channel
MEVLDNLLTTARGLIPSVAAIIVTVGLGLALRMFFNRRFAGSQGYRFRLQMSLMFISFVGLLVVILVLPVSEGTVGQLLSLLGLLLSAAIALSATTFVGNIMGGLMLRAVRNFRSGDFIQVGDHFGRVSERGLFHVEIQTEDRDLTTLPNLYLVTNPVKVKRSSGTLLTAEVSLGYDVPRRAVEPALLQAAADAGLTEPFVHVRCLGDFSVVYRVAGLLPEVKSLLTARSRLREGMLDRLHEAGIEIVSPTFMNQRPLAPEQRFIPPKLRTPEPEKPADLPEALVFDKADEAESLENLRERHSSLRDDIKLLKEQIDNAETSEEKDQLTVRLDRLQARATRLAEYISEREKGSK